jgi:hypothetical protein
MNANAAPGPKRPNIAAIQNPAKIALSFLQS